MRGDRVRAAGTRAAIMGGVGGMVRPRFMGGHETKIVRRARVLYASAVRPSWEGNGASWASARGVASAVRHSWDMRILVVNASWITVWNKVGRIFV